MKPGWRHLAITLACLTLAALQRFWIAPLLERLPANYSNQIALVEENQFRESLTAGWQASTLDSVRIDQTITTSDQVSIIEGGLHVYFTTGQVNFEVISLYGVDRRTRQNVSGYGQVNRTGQFLFPTHVQKSAYPIWDPWFVGLRQASFDRVETLDGLQVYVFKFLGTGMDETAGYDYLADVPERYLAHTDGQGTIWVEPVSGSVVNYEDTGVSYFVDPATGAHVADFNIWSEKFTPQTSAAQLEKARTARLRILALEDWLPGGLLLAGLVSLGLFLFTRKKNLPTG
jgi:hypothetical protein